MRFLKSSLIFPMLAFLAAIAFVTAGCHHGHVYARGPSYITVDEPPPAAIYETCPACPGEGYIWIDGYWNWDRDRHHYKWEHGRWAKPPRSHARWEGPRYEKHEQYRYTPGHWREETREHHR